jgi:hypothetical protein
MAFVPRAILHLKVSNNMLLSFVANGSGELYLLFNGETPCPLSRAHTIEASKRFAKESRGTVRIASELLDLSIEAVFRDCPYLFMTYGPAVSHGGEAKGEAAVDSLRMFLGCLNLPDDQMFVGNNLGWALMTRGESGNTVTCNVRHAVRDYILPERGRGSEASFVYSDSGRIDILRTGVPPLMFESRFVPNVARWLKLKKGGTVEWLEDGSTTTTLRHVQEAS